MPIIKQISIHSTPEKTIEYVLNGEKNDEMKYATGLNCNADANCAYEEMRRVYEHFAKERFSKVIFDEDKSKHQVRLHHFIQSFDPKEKISPSEAHQIGIEWAKKTFGEDMQVIVSTHLDKGHIHNHFAVQPYDLKGKHYVSNKATLKRARIISDDIAIVHGLKIIENPKYKANHDYGEWKHRNNKSSWKQKLCDNIDKLILKVDSIEMLKSELEKLGYEVTQNKYITIRPINTKYSIRSFRLGDGYSLEDMEYRILHKEQEMTIPAILEKYKDGLQVDYALYIRKMQINVFHKISYTSARANYYNLRKSANVLNFVASNNIHSKEDFAKCVADARDKVAVSKAEIKLINKEIKLKKQVVEDSEEYLKLMQIDIPTAVQRKRIGELSYIDCYNISNNGDVAKLKAKISELEGEVAKKENGLVKLEQERKEVGSLFATFSEQFQDDFTRVVEETKKQIADEQRIEEQVREELNNEIVKNNLVK